MAITIDTGAGADFSPMIALCKELDVPYHFISTYIKQIVFDYRKEANPCSLCANLRRGALNDAAKELGCNKVALGHHKNDAVETLLMSMFYEGRVSSFSPKTTLTRSGITVIRPLIYIEASDIRRAARDYNYTIVSNPCPENGHSKRQYVKDLIYNLSKEIPDLKDHLLGSLTNTNQVNLWYKEN